MAFGQNQVRSPSDGKLDFDKLSKLLSSLPQNTQSPAKPRKQTVFSSDLVDPVLDADTNELLNVMREESQNLKAKVI
jgi:hypothetical protein